jgi:NADPH-dependent ferric siderophore reductase
MGAKMRMTQVARVEDISPHMKRIILSGDDLNDFPLQKESAHVKIILPQANSGIPKLGMYLGFKKWMRSYTVRYFDDVQKELTIDFAVNDHNGLATNWAAKAKPGDYLGIAGPGDTKHTDYNADWHLIVADLTALPAAAAVIEKLPEHAKGYAIIQVPTAEDIQIINAPKQLKVDWVINADVNQDALLNNVEKLPWLNGTPAIFVAMESSQMKAIKKWLKAKPNYTKALTYASGYWKHS